MGRRTDSSTTTVTPDAYVSRRNRGGSSTGTREKTAAQRAAAIVPLLAGGLMLRYAWRARRAIEFSKKTVVIFGGSRGLGLVLARELALEGAHLVLVARDAKELEHARIDVERLGAPVRTYECDIRNRDEVSHTIERVVGDHGTVDVLINDAGIIQVGPLEHMTLEDFENAMATHFWGPLCAILAVLPHMRRDGARRIVNISSIGGRIAVPHLVPYSASKFALTGLSEGLHAELAREGIRVTTVSPGLMRTGSTYNAWFKGQHRREFTWFHLAGSIPGLSIDARRAARQILEACRHGDAQLTITPPARLAVLLNAACPETMARMMSLTNWLLPSAVAEGGDKARSGWQSVSQLTPSLVTTLADRASTENNELPPGATGSLDSRRAGDAVEPKPAMLESRLDRPMHPSPRHDAS
jgi:NAD(P)-dependent dehydrogenase (short-subunit alcohol dehydrogenase family)